MTLTSVSQTIANLEVVVRTPGENAKSDYNFIILHGYGADAHDLAPLSDMFHCKTRGTWYFPHAPLSVPIGPGMYGRGWFPIDLNRLESIANSLDQLPGKFEGIDESTAQIIKLIDELNLDPSKTIIGGFSQGSMVSLHAASQIAMRDGKPFAGLILFSTGPAAMEDWSKNAIGLRSTPIYQSHGRQDQILPFQGAQVVEQLLRKDVVNYTFHPFEGGHELPPEILSAANLFLNEICK